MTRPFTAQVRRLGVVALFALHAYAADPIGPKIEIIAGDGTPRSSTEFNFDDRPVFAVIVNEQVVGFNYAVSLARDLFRNDGYKKITVCNSAALGDVNLESCTVVVAIGAEAEVLPRIKPGIFEVYIVLPETDVSNVKLNAAVYDSQRTKERIFDISNPDFPVFFALILMDGHTSSTRMKDWNDWAVQKNVPTERIRQKTPDSIQAALRRAFAEVTEMRRKAKM